MHLRGINTTRDNTVIDVLLDTDIHIDIELVTINRNMNSEPDTEYHILP